MAHLLIYILVPVVVMLAVGLATFHYLSPSLSAQVAGRLGGRFWGVTSLVSLGIYLAAIAFSVLLPVAIDPVEVTVVSVSELWHRGYPLYVGLYDPERYSLLYGPICYLPFAAAFSLFGSSLTTAKLLVAFLNVALLISLWAAFRRVLTASETLVATGFTAIALMMKQMPTFQMRGDILLVVAISVALWAISFRRAWLSVSIVSLACACAVDVKFTAIVSFLIPFYLLWRRHGRKSILAGVIATPVLAALPFLSPGVSLPNYLVWLHAAARHPLLFRVFAMNVTAALILVAVPVMIGGWLLGVDHEKTRELMRCHWVGILLFALGVGGSVITGSKVGAGRSHLNMILIVSAYLAARLWARVGPANVRSASPGMRYLFAGCAIVLLIPALSEVDDLWGICVLRRPYAEAVNRDLDQVLMTHPGSRVEIGYGNTPTVADSVNALSMFGPRLVFAGNTVTVDAGALFDMGLSGVTIPRSTIDVVRACRTQLWLIPRGEVPFSLVNVYSVDVPKDFEDPNLFSPEFRRAFFETYRKTGQSRFYDLWSCASGTHG